MSLFDDILNKKPQPEVKAPDISASSELTESFGQQTAQVTNSDPSIIISNSTPIITSRDVLAEPVEIQMETPVINPVAAPMIEITEASSIAPVVASNDFILTDPNTISFIENDISSVASSDDSASASPLFDMMSEPMVQAEEPLVAEEVVVADEIISMPITSGSTFRDTAEYIGHAIEEVGELMSTLDAANDAKIAERDGYKAQKEQFASLEEKAEAEHQKMLIERAHAKKMETYLKHEKEKTTPAANDETFAIAA